jgi:monoamine oxidase
MALPAEVDVVVIGAGAAGIAAGRRLAQAYGVSFVVLEARSRTGGRAHTQRLGEFHVDMGCGWLHSGDINPWTTIAEGLGLTIDRSPPPWMKQAFDVGFSAEEQAAYRAEFEALDERIEAAAEGPDRPVSALFAPGCRWNALLDAFSGFYNGAPFEEISVHDYAAYEDTEVNWRVAEGYGTAVIRHGADLPLALETPVTRIDHSGVRLRIETPRGTVEARAAIVAVPTTPLAEERLRFFPELPDKVEAAGALPLGHVDKAFLALSEPEAFPAETHLFGRIDTALTASYHRRPFHRPLIEVFVGGALAAELEKEGAASFGAFAVDELVALLGSDMRRKLTPLGASNWGPDPWTGGAYSHAKVGQAGMRAVLAAPVDGRLFFAGEACSPHGFSTAHGAYQSGALAAEAALAALGNPRGG